MDTVQVAMRQAPNKGGSEASRSAEIPEADERLAENCMESRFGMPAPDGRGRSRDMGYTETLDMLEDEDAMKALEESEGDIRAGRVSIWTRTSPNAPSR